MTTQQHENKYLDPLMQELIDLKENLKDFTLFKNLFSYGNDKETKALTQINNQMEQIMKKLLRQKEKSLSTRSGIHCFKRLQ